MSVTYHVAKLFLENRDLGGGRRVGVPEELLSL